MNINDFIDELITELAYRTDTGIPDLKNRTHLNLLSQILNEWGMIELENSLLPILTEDDKEFKNPALNKVIKYKNVNGEDAEGKVGNLLRRPKEEDAHIQAVKALGGEDSDGYKKAMDDLGAEGQPQRDIEKERETDDSSTVNGQGEDQPQTGTALSPDTESGKEYVQNLPDGDPAKVKPNADKETETPNGEKEDGGFKPIDRGDVKKEIPNVDSETFSGDSDIPDGVSSDVLEKFNTDIQKVAQQVADAKAKGEPAPNINLCKVTVPGTNLYCDNNLGIPRDEMPQFKGTAEPGSRAASMKSDVSGEVDTEPVFREMLKEKGIKTLQTEIPADKLKATQKDLVGAKVVGMMGALDKDPNHPAITAPIYVSRDGYVIDGHHRWAAVVAYNAANPDNQIPMKTTVIDMDIKDAIPMANKFAEDIGIAAKKADANKETPTENKPEEVVDNLKNRTTTEGEKLDID